MKGDTGMQETTATRGWLELAEIREVEAELTGGKAARLGQLKRHGFLVPDGFVIITALFEDARGAKDAIAEALPRLGTGTRVAVRSSATAEDLEEASFAGQYETVLGVAGAEAVLAAVKECWASARAARVAEYSQHQAAGQAGPVAVLVQKLVEAEAAGVAYSANPVTGDRNEVVISSVRGLGERLVAGEAAPDEWTVTAATAVCTRHAEGAIDAAGAERIARLARDVAEHLRGPQDIEWAWAGGELYLLQSRPMTGLPQAVEWKSPAPGGFFRHFRFGEWLGDPVTPLFETWLLDRMEAGLDDQFWRIGGSRVPRPYHVVVNGWCFYSMNFLPKGLGAMWRVVIGWVPKLLINPRRALRLFPNFWRLTLEPGIKDWKEVAQPRLRQAVRAAAARVEQAGTDELVALVDGLATEAGAYFMSLMGVSGSAAKAETPLAVLYSRHVEPEVGGSYLDLLQGLYTPKLGDQDHAVQSLDWYHPTLGELTLELETPAASESRRRRLTEARQRAESKARAALRTQPKVLAKFEAALAIAQRLQPMREEQALEFTLGWPVMRRALARLGANLVERGVIDEPGQIHFLTREEIIRGNGRLGDAARRRRRVWERQRRLNPPLILGDIDSRVQSIIDSFTTPRQGRSTSPDVLAGIAASAGRATGPARVIRRIEDFDRLQPGDILIAPATTPAWTPLFARAGAVVTDTGSVGTHSSQVAREYGIPAVVCTGDATVRLRDGQLVTVDGSRGVVAPAG